MRLIDFLKKNVKKTSGMFPGGSPKQEEREMLIADPNEVKKLYLQMYSVWQSGDSNVIRNFYSRANGMNLNYEPWYWKGMRSSYWASVQSEDDIITVTSGIAPAITYTLSLLLGKPTFKVGTAKRRAIHKKDGEESNPEQEAQEKYEEELTARLKTILDEQDFWSLYGQQKTCTLYQGWGCYKVTWDKAVSDHPYLVYYMAEDVDFVWKASKLISVIFKDWYQDPDNIGKKYLVTETRTLVVNNDENGKLCRAVQIETKAFRQMPVGGGDTELTEIKDFSGLPELNGIEQKIVINNFTDLWAYPTILFEDDQSSDVHFPGRSVHSGRIDLYDSLDMCLSQGANAVCKSTPVEYFNSDFLERDIETGLPKMPHRYDRKYVAYKGGQNVDGTSNTTEPVQVTQPNINFQQYSLQAVEIMKMILTGLLSPATMGIDVARQATAESMREKEKITIATRNHMIDNESAVLKRAFSGVLCAEEYLCTGKITTKKYDITIQFDEYANSSLEEKLGVNGEQLDNGNMSAEMFLDLTYGDSLSDSDYEAELAYLKKLHDPETQMEMQQEAQEEQMEMQGQDPMGEAMGEVQDDDGNIDVGAMASAMGGGSPKATGVEVPKGE